MKRIQSIVFAILLTSPAFGQPKDTIRVAVRMDNLVYVYQTVTLPLGYGFNIYRQDAAKGEFLKLNDAPVRSIQYGDEFRVTLGPIFDELRTTFNEDNASAILLNLRNNPAEGLLATFAHPEVAQALGRLFIDRNAPIGKKVTYQLKVVDPFGKETGRVFSTSTTLTPEQPTAPTALTVSNAEDVVTLTWKYPKNAAGRDDKVIRFDVYRQPESSAQPVKENRRSIIRNEAADVSTFIFRVPLDGRQNQVFVRALDITGQASPPSVTLRFSVRDTMPPAPPSGVEATLLPKDVVEVTWPVSVESDVQGYNVYRTVSVEQKAKLQKLTPKLLPMLQTVFRDTTISVERRNYFYRITAVDRAGNESKPSNAAMAQVEDHTPPPRPATLQAEYQKDKTVKLTWPAIALPPDFQTYIINRRKLAAGVPDMPTRLNIGNVRESMFVDKGDGKEGLLPGASYQYTVASADSVRNISDSVAVVITIPRPTGPDAPTSLRAANDLGIRAVITWSAPPTGDIAGYTLFRQERGKKEQTVFRLPTTHLTYRDETVRKPVTYVYWITARDSIGRESKPSRPDTVFIRDFTPPRMVRNVRAEVTDRGVHVTWEPAADSVVGYRVFRAPIATGVFETLTKDMVKSTDYVDRAGKANLWYRVQTYDPSGNESHLSDPAQAADLRPASRRLVR